MIALLQGKYTKNPPYHHDTEESFVKILESNLAEPLVNLRSLRFHVLGILLLGDDTDAVAVVAVRCGLHDVLQRR